MSLEIYAHLFASGEHGGLDSLVTAGRRDPICPAPLTERLIGTLRSASAEVRAFRREATVEEFETIRAFLPR